MIVKATSNVVSYGSHLGWLIEVSREATRRRRRSCFRDGAQTRSAEVALMQSKHNVNMRKLDQPGNFRPRVFTECLLCKLGYSGDRLIASLPVS